jgi:hypothetical protein
MSILHTAAGYCKALLVTAERRPLKRRKQGRFGLGFVLRYSGTTVVGAVMAEVRIFRPDDCAVPFTDGA